MSDGEGATATVSVRFAAHPSSVRTARQLVAATLREQDLPQLVDDASLIVTELCTNSVLHSGAPYFHVAVDMAPDDGVRLAVGDQSAVPAAAIVRRQEARRAGAVPEVRPERTTGRGLAIVDALASAWGVTVEQDHTWVWVALQTSGAEQGEGFSPAPVAAGAVDGRTEALPAGWHAVRLEGCPVRLGLEQDAHLDELVRELQLVEPSTAQPAVAGLIRELLERQAAARHLGRRTAQDAAQAGLELVDLEMLLPEGAAEEVLRLQAAVSLADETCEREELLTLASSAEIRTLRLWMTQEIREQITTSRAPQRYDDWLTARRTA